MIKYSKLKESIEIPLSQNPDNYIDAIKVQIEKAEQLCNAARDILERT